jgi:SsrA-binding protein
LAHKREIIKLTRAQDADNSTLVPLKIYFSGGRAKILIGVGQGRKKFDKRHAIAKREAQRDMDRAMHYRG